VASVTKCVYLRLALNNLRKNRQTYLPFLLASTLLTFTMYSFLMIAFNPGFEKVHGGMQFVVILDFGIGVVGLFTAIFLFYANGFLIKRRKKEMGLYAILGMEKRHVARVLRHEMSLTWLASMVAGLTLGVLLTRLLFLLIRLAIRVDVPLVGAVSVTALWLTALIFAFLFLLLIAYNGLQVRMVNPVQLLRGGQVGEREPRAHWVLAVLGVLCAGAGYWLAQYVDNPVAAIALFFVAVILVIVGTYLLFLTGSIALLKLLKHNKRYYYRASHFVTVSGLLYRMKQNAAGLASIAILCTMAMVTVGTTAALYNGSEKMLTEYYPCDMQVTMDTAAEQAAVEIRNRELAAEAGVSVTDFHAVNGSEVVFALNGAQLVGADTENVTGLNDYGRMHYALLLTGEEYAALEGAPLPLAANEIGCWTTAKSMPETIEIGSTSYTLRMIDSLAVTPCLSSGSGVNTTYLVLPDDATARAILTQAGETDSAPVYTSQWNMQGSENGLKAYYAAASDKATGWTGHNLRVKSSLREEWYAMHGGFLFVGIFLGLIFLMGTAMILYFKQVSEGYQDHDRFIIMQQVGMSPEEVKGTVRRQILMVFFLPLLVAVCHVGGSLHMVTLMLRLFGLMDAPYIALNTFLAAAGVMALYGFFYIKTAGTYYKLVKF
jgi:putative ABC transport system permease protein